MVRFTFIGTGVVPTWRVHAALTVVAWRITLLATRRTRRRATALLAAVALTAAACGGTEGDDTEPTEADAAAEDAAEADDPADPAAEDDDAEDGGGETSGEPLTVYSGRNEEFVGSIFDDFTADTGIEVDVRYGDTAELAATIIEEGDASPADVFFAQDAGALGALQAEGLLTELSEDLVDQVEPTFRSREGQWVGTTGRVRVLAYNTDQLSEDEVPDSVFDLTDPEWEGRVGWAPTNGSFQAFVTAMRVSEGEDVTRDWLEAMIANDPAEFENNSSTVEGVSRGEVEVGLVNHYYLLRFTAEDPEFPVENKFLPGDIGGLVNIAGVGVLGTSDQSDDAEALVGYLLSDEVQEFFGQNTDTVEFPVVEGVGSPQLPSLDEIDPPDVDLSNLDDLQGTLELLQEVGALS